MGGCRCTYRNCTVKSDGQTHMFHYPVFDKVRCHQWLTNAHRLDFLDLKVSQLKNRVVCQHHFKEEYFMNFKKEKLTFDAVPTEDGPFCDSSKISGIDVTQEKANTCPIILEDIENEHLSFKEKRANFSVKYADFLTTTNDLMEPFFLNIDNLRQPTTSKSINNWSISTVHQEEANNATQSSNNKASTPSYAYLHSRISLPPESHKKQQMQPMLVVQPFSNDAENNPATQGNVFLEYNIDNNQNNAGKTELLSGQNISSNIANPKKNKIRIISQKQIFEPLPIRGNLRPVSPSIVLRASNKKKEVETQSLQECDIKPIFQEDNKPSIQEVNVEFEFLDKSDLNANAQPVQSNILPTNYIHQMDSNPVVTNKSRAAVKSVTSLLKPQSGKSNKSSCDTMAMLVKNKIPPERVAAIEEKRNFNKLKLRDMIEFCLDELEEQDRVIDKTPKTLNECKNLKNKIDENTLNKHIAPDQNIVTRSEINTKTVKKETRDTLNENKATKRSDMNNINIENVTSYLSKEPSLPSAGEYNMASIEARMRRMEDILLSKIDQNSQKIVDLKHSLVTSSCEKKTVFTQTSESEESYKRHLFNEISKFLSPDANSLIYEELFINKYAQSSTKELPVEVQPLKRRRRR